MSFVFNPTLNLNSPELDNALSQVLSLLSDLNTQNALILNNTQGLITVANQILEKETKIMAAIDDLNAVEAKEEADISAIKTAITTYQAKQAATIAELEAALAASTSTPAVAAAVAKLQANNTVLEGIAASLTTPPVVQPPSTVPPPPTT